MTLEFTHVDVFTRRPLEGNQLAVFHSGAGLSAARMQAIAREMNLAETTFVFPGGPKSDARVRIFTVTEELPFAGHPTLGTAFVLAQSRPDQTLIRLQEKVGVIPVTVRREKRGAYMEMRQRDPLFGATIDRAKLAALIGVPASHLDPRYPPQVVSTGVPFLITPLRTRQALDRLEPNYKKLAPLLHRRKAHFPYYIVTGEDELEARMFAQTFEDPATGSAGGCAAAYLVKHGRCAPGVRFLIHQGRSIRRPSEVFASAANSGGRVHNVRVGGYVVEVLKGTLCL